MAGTAKITLVMSKDLETKLDTFARSISRDIASKARDELKEGYQKILDSFYEDGWEPAWYKRTGQLRANSYVGVLDAGHPYHAFGGIAVTPERLHYKKMGKNFTTDDVIDDFLESSHGGWVQSPVNVWRDVIFLLERTTTKVSSGKVFDDIVAEARAKAGL